MLANHILHYSVLKWDKNGPELEFAAQNQILEIIYEICFMEYQINR